MSELRSGPQTHPIANAAEHILHAPVRTVGLAPSWTALACILHALTQTLAGCRGESTQEGIVRMDAFMRSYTDALRQQSLTARDSIAEYTATTVSDRARSDLLS